MEALIHQLLIHHTMLSYLLQALYLDQQSQIERLQAEVGRLTRENHDLHHTINDACRLFKCKKCGHNVKACCESNDGFRGILKWFRELEIRGEADDPEKQKKMLAARREMAKSVGEKFGRQFLKSAQRSRSRGASRGRSRERKKDGGRSKSRGKSDPSKKKRRKKKKKKGGDGDDAGQEDGAEDEEEEEEQAAPSPPPPPAVGGAKNNAEMVQAAAAARSVDLGRFTKSESDVRHTLRGI